MNIEELKKILQEHEVSEETFAALTTLVESHVKTKLAEQEEQHLEEAQQVLTNVLEEQNAAREAEYETKLQEQTELMAKKVDAYIDEVVKEFIAENKKSFDMLEDYDRMKKAHQAILESFETNGFPINKDANAQKALQEAADAKAQYTALFEEKRAVMEENDKLKREAIFASATKSLADTQVEKVVKMMESVQFASIGEMETGMKLIVEQVTKSPEASKPVETRPAAPKNTLMEQALSKL